MTYKPSWGSGGGGPHAASHAVAQSDEVSPASLGAATDADLDMLADLVADHIAVAALDSELAAHTGAAAPHSGHATDAEVATAVQDGITDHEALGDPHVLYQLESEKNAASGYAPLDAGGLLPSANLPNHSTDKLTAGTLPVVRGGTGQVTVQAAIDALSGAAGATNEHVLTKDTGTGNAIFKAAPGGSLTRHFIRADVDRTLPNDTNVNAIFNSPANGRVTLTTGVYIFEGILLITAMSGTSGNALINLLGAGTAVIGSWAWRLAGLDNSAPATISADLMAYFQVAVSAASAVTAGTGTALRLFLKGSFEVTTAGTMIPSIDLVTAAAAVVQDGSWLDIERVGNVNIASVGSWD